MSSNDLPDVVLPALLIPTPPSLAALRAFFFVFLLRCASLVCPSESSMLSTSSKLVNLSRNLGTNAADLAGADAEAPVELIRRCPGCNRFLLAVEGMASGLGKAGTTVGSTRAAIAALLALRFLFPRPMPESSSSSSTTVEGATTGGGSPRTYTPSTSLGPSPASRRQRIKGSSAPTPLPRTRSSRYHRVPRLTAGRSSERRPTARTS